ncbi:hypothetical protein [Paenimyroides aestuarii]|uniref:Uncharacterized protein n=1 Tax=Paenimyroides aestuarii TaxID=2968490 RepID=A0ABY5NUU9_9FLAO|nr:hypothetical protein [Paenimyroides aestuarii]UUV22366.1 hypothetical protein NPX36_04825 [Paenimyroides aestuarii]
MRINYVLKRAKHVLCILTLLTGFALHAQNLTINFPLSKSVQASTSNHFGLMSCNATLLEKQSTTITPNLCDFENVKTSNICSLGKESKDLAKKTRRIAENGGGANAPNLRNGFNFKTSAL